MVSCCTQHTPQSVCLISVLQRRSNVLVAKSVIAQRASLSAPNFVEVGALKRQLENISAAMSVAQDAQNLAKLQERADEIKARISCATRAIVDAKLGRVRSEPKSCCVVLLCLGCLGGLLATRHSLAYSGMFHQDGCRRCFIKKA